MTEEKFEAVMQALKDVHTETERAYKAVQISANKILKVAEILFHEQKGQEGGTIEEDSSSGSGPGGNQHVTKLDTTVHA